MAHSLLPTNTVVHSQNAANAAVSSSTESSNRSTPTPCVKMVLVAATIWPAKGFDMAEVGGAVRVRFTGWQANDLRCDIPPCGKA